jgi:hypothetical protein
LCLSRYQCINCRISYTVTFLTSSRGSGRSMAPSCSRPKQPICLSTEQLWKPRNTRDGHVGHILGALSSHTYDSEVAKAHSSQRQQDTELSTFRYSSLSSAPIGRLVPRNQTSASSSPRSGPRVMPPGALTISRWPARQTAMLLCRSPDVIGGTVKYCNSRTRTQNRPSCKPLVRARTGPKLTRGKTSTASITGSQPVPD